MRFAHIADTHLGAFRERELREMNVAAFEKAIEACIAAEVDFIIIAGDLFHVALPEMSIVRRAVEAIQKAREHDIAFYLIYGSHDYTANETSIIDVLGSAGLFTKIVDISYEESEETATDDAEATKTAEEQKQKLILRFFTDKKTNAKLVGISGRKGGLESEYYAALDLPYLENEMGFKIFVFHSAITEYKPSYLADVASVPLSALPKGFAYYASGHVHERFVHDAEGYGLIVSPGPLFGADYRDLEKSAHEERGFYILDTNDDIKDLNNDATSEAAEGRKVHSRITPTFVPIKLHDIETITYDATGKTAAEVAAHLEERIASAPIADKILLIKIQGELGFGKSSDIPFDALRKTAMERGAITVSINRHGLSTKEEMKISVRGESAEDVEKKLFQEYIGGVAVKDCRLTGHNGTALAERLLAVLKEEQNDGEKKEDFERKIVERAKTCINDTIKEAPKKRDEEKKDETKKQTLETSSAPLKSEKKQEKNKHQNERVRDGSLDGWF